METMDYCWCFAITHVYIITPTTHIKDAILFSSSNVPYNIERLLITAVNSNRMTHTIIKQIMTIFTTIVLLIVDRAYLIIHIYLHL